jgi:type II secretory pathway component PulM
MPEKEIPTNQHAGESEPDKLARFKREIAIDADNLLAQREEANEDMRFINTRGGMWENFQEEEFSDRVKLEFDTAGDYLQRYIGECNENRIGVEFKPDDSKTSDKDAELLNGIFRADAREGSFKVSSDNAVLEQGTCGYGCLKLGTYFEDEEDPENMNQRIDFRPLFNSYALIVWDISAKWQNKKDARRCTVLTEYTRDSFAAAFPGEHDAISAYVPETQEFENRDINVKDRIYIATHYEIVKKKEPVFVYGNLRTGELEIYSKEDHELIKDELRNDELREFRTERKIVKQRVEMSVFSGAEFLEKPRRIIGKWIPIVPFYGFRAYVDGAERYRGLVRKLKDPARLFNMQISQLAENAASAGQEVPILTREQVEGYEEFWADKNNRAYLLINETKDNDGNTLPVPIQYHKPPGLDQSTAALLQIVPDFLRGATGGAPQDTLDPNASGKAIKAMLKRENLNTQPMKDNIADAIEWLGTVYQSMATEIYTEKRIVRIISKDGTSGEAQLSETIFDKETGIAVEVGKLSGKKFRSYADIGPQSETLREETTDTAMKMIETLAPLPAAGTILPELIGIAVENMSGSGMQSIKEMSRKQRLAQGTIEPETDEERAFVEQLQEQAQQEDPQQKLIEAATQQQLSEARNLDAASAEKIKSAELKDAQTRKTLSDIQVNQEKTASDIRVNEAKTLADIREKVFQNLQELPIAL